MRANHIVVTAPTLDDDLRLSQCVEDLAIEQFVAQAIARETGVARNTVPRYLRDEAAARYKPRPPRSTKL